MTRNISKGPARVQPTLAKSTSTKSENTLSVVTGRPEDAATFFVPYYVGEIF